MGRRANTDSLNLDAAGVAYDRSGITVNDFLQTSARNIYAVGDVVGPYRFSHMANAQGIRATQNAILPLRRRFRYGVVPWVTFTEPELARTGLTEEEARREHGDSIRVYDVDLNDLDRTRTAGPSRERAKLVLDRRGRVLGASILADRAGEMIGEVQVVASLGVPFSKLSGIVHPYPTYAEVFQQIGKRVLIDRILGNPLVKLFTGRGSS
ncbi:MAG: FAD-dependent oxidoreductase [Spirochaetota bacterium]